MIVRAATTEKGAAPSTAILIAPKADPQMTDKTRRMKEQEQSHMINKSIYVRKKPEQMDGKRFTYISASSRLTVWEAVGPWLERTGACWLVQQAP